MNDSKRKCKKGGERIFHFLKRCGYPCLKNFMKSIKPIGSMRIIMPQIDLPFKVRLPDKWDKYENFYADLTMVRECNCAMPVRNIYEDEII